MAQGGWALRRRLCAAQMGAQGPPRLLSTWAVLGDSGHRGRMPTGELDAAPWGEVRDGFTGTGEKEEEMGEGKQGEE